VLDGGPYGHSVFTGSILEAIKEGLADFNGDGYITYAELISYLVPAATNPYQTPAPAYFPGHGSGEFVFRSPKGATKVIVEKPVPDETVPRGEKAASTKIPSVIPKKEFTNSIGMMFVLIPAGSFTMGSRLSPEEVVSRFGGEAGYFKDEHPKHPVKITKPFYLQTTEVSQGQWEKVMGDNPSRFKDCGDDCPVEAVSWNYVQEFIFKLNQMESTNKYRLPTEAEWEYACRAGTRTTFFTGECISTDQANYDGIYPGNNCPKGQYREKTVKVGSFQPNAWGLYDMHGNVWEWVEDDWHNNYKGAPTDGRAWVDNPRRSSRVLRGGSWSYDAWFVRSASRYGFKSVYRSHSKGFRVARDL
jgi:formylglycine-generating enzyme required for sulfatase activity